MSQARFFRLPILTAILFSLSSHAGTNGEELKLVKKPDGRFSFGVTYAYDVDFAWMTTFSTQIPAKELEALPTKVKWNLFNKKTGKFFTTWTETEKRSLKLGAFKIDKKSLIKELLTNQADLELVFGVEKDGKIESKYYLPIGEFCKKELTDYFKNLSETDKRCDQIKEADVSVAQRETSRPQAEDLIRHPVKKSTRTHGI